MKVYFSEGKGYEASRIGEEIVKNEDVSLVIEITDDKATVSDLKSEIYEKENLVVTVKREGKEDVVYANYKTAEYITETVSESERSIHVKLKM